MVTDEFMLALSAGTAEQPDTQGDKMMPKLCWSAAAASPALLPGS